MDEVRIWALDDSAKAAPLEAKGQMDTEWSFEDTLVKNPELLMPELTLVGRQTPTEGGPLDLLGVDSDGRLVVFELKRGALSRDAVAQIIDYASALDAMDPRTLAAHIAGRSGMYDIPKIEDFEEWYNQRFGEQDLESLRPLRMFLVGLGADDTTERMVTFLANNSNMDISLLTFHGFAYGGKTFLAKQVQVEGADELKPARRSLSRKEKIEQWVRRAEEEGVSEPFAAARDMFRENWHNPREAPHSLGIDLKLMEIGARRNHYPAYARIDPNPGKVRLVFYRTYAVESSM